MLVGGLAALIAALLWSMGSFLFTTAVHKIGSIQLNIDRMAGATILLLITLLILGINITATPIQIFYLVLSGFIGLVIGDSALFRAFQEMGPRVSLLIYSSNPAIAALLAYLIFGETVSLYAYLGIVLVLSGIAFVVTEKPNKEFASRFKVTKIGVIMAFLSAIGQAGGLILAKMAFSTGEIHSMVATVIRIASAVIIMLPFSILLKKYKNPFKLYKKEISTLKLVGIGSIIGPYLGISLSFVAVMNVPMGIASTLLSTVPIMVLPMSWFVYKEKLSARSIIGAVVAFAGVAMLFVV